MMIPAESGDDSSLFPLVIGGDLQTGDVSGGNGSMKSHIISQQDWVFNNGDVICGNGFIKIHTLSQCNDSSSFKDMDGDVENYNVSGGHGSMKKQTLYQQNGFKPLINLNNSDDIDMNADLEIVRG